MRSIPLLTNLCGLLSFCLALTARAEDVPRAPKPEMKGMELYSWRDRTTGEWTFALVEGTNAQKSPAKIMAPQSAINGVEALESRLARLAVGEHVMWNGAGLTQAFPLPPPGLVQQISAFSKSKQIELHIAGQ